MMVASVSSILRYVCTKIEFSWSLSSVFRTLKDGLNLKKNDQENSLSMPTTINTLLLRNYAIKSTPSKSMVQWDINDIKQCVAGVQM